MRLVVCYLVLPSVPPPLHPFRTIPRFPALDNQDGPNAKNIQRCRFVPYEEPWKRKKKKKRKEKKKEKKKKEIKMSLLPLPNKKKRKKKNTSHRFPNLFPNPKYTPIVTESLFHVESRDV